MFNRLPALKQIISVFRIPSNIWNVTFLKNRKINLKLFDGVPIATLHLTMELFGFALT